MKENKEQKKMIKYKVPVVFTGTRVTSKKLSFRKEIYIDRLMQQIDRKQKIINSIFEKHQKQIEEIERYLS